MTPDCKSAHGRKDLALWAASVRYYRSHPEMWWRLAHIVRVCAPQPGDPLPPSLRCIFYFVTSYAKQYPQQVVHGRLTTEHDAHDLYRHMLRVHTKRRFDPFCRRQKTPLKLHDVTLDTNVGQLVFFRWFFETGLYDRLTALHGHVQRQRREGRRGAGASAVRREPRPSASASPKVVLRWQHTATASPVIRIAVRFG